MKIQFNVFLNCILGAALSCFVFFGSAALNPIADAEICAIGRPLPVVSETALVGKVKYIRILDEAAYPYKHTLFFDFLEDHFAVIFIPNIEECIGFSGFGRRNDFSQAKERVHYRAEKIRIGDVRYGHLKRYALTFYGVGSRWFVNCDDKIYRCIFVGFSKIHRLHFYLKPSSLLFNNQINASFSSVSLLYSKYGDDARTEGESEIHEEPPENIVVLALRGTYILIGGAVLWGIGIFLIDRNRRVGNILAYLGVTVMILGWGCILTAQWRDYERQKNESAYSQQHIFTANASFSLAYTGAPSL
jgi:hypothetical protein